MWFAEWLLLKMCCPVIDLKSSFRKGFVSCSQGSCVTSFVML